MLFSITHVMPVLAPSVTTDHPYRLLISLYEIYFIWLGWHLNFSTQFMKNVFGNNKIKKYMEFCVK
jgi:hypothetical protein